MALGLALKRHQVTDRHATPQHREKMRAGKVNRVSEDNRDHLQAEGTRVRTHIAEMEEERRPEQIQYKDNKQEQERPSCPKLPKNSQC